MQKVKSSKQKGIMRTTMQPKVIVAAIIAACAAPQQVFAENRAEAIELGKVEVVSTTPLPGVGVALDQVPANVQSVKAKDIAQQHTLELSDYINNNLGGVTITEGQSNPYMADVNFRGFTASPLAGAPQGLSVFQDGVRINEPFGDTVNWGLIPQSAISSINLMPGSNPVFGLNTLGGALSVNTKSGASNPGLSAEMSGGSWGRRNFNASYGGVDGNVDYFITGNYAKEDGWRDSSSSEVNQLFGKIGWQNETTDLDLSITLAHNNLNGVQALPKSWLNKPEQAYTYPDTIGNRMQMINLKGSHFLSDDHLIAGNIYVRNSRITNFASNTNDCFNASLADQGIGAQCDQSLPESVDIANQGFNEKSSTSQLGYGLTAQYSFLGDVMKHKNQFTAGLSADLGNSSYKADEQPTEFTPNRGAVATDAFQRETDIRTKNQYFGLYATDIFSVTDKLHVTLAGRYNYVRVNIKDKMEADPNTGKYVSGDADHITHTFNRFNPAVGLNYNISPALGFYGSYNEGMRAPSPIELSCADPLTPCRLPTDFLADPVLKPVVSKTFEAGVRGLISPNMRWNATVFQTNLNDDIQFISSGNSFNLGYFDNVGKTQRQGLELGFGGNFDKFQITANYQYLRATYQDSITFHNENNMSAEAQANDGNYTAKRGDYLPNIPKHSLKVRLAYDFTPNLNVGLNVISSANIYARGDENNKDPNGKVAGYTILNMDANWKFHENWTAFMKLINLADKDYSTMGILGTNAFNTADRSLNTDPGGWQAEQFQSPGAPRAGWVGVRYDFGKPKATAALDND